MRIKRNKKGFTLAELLIVVAIIGILGGVGFIAVQTHQRSLTRLERDSVAKEIFVAAQNHLTSSESQGFMGDSLNYGEQDGANYYITVSGGSGFTADGSAMLDMMLPFGSIDEKVRMNDNYVICYHANPAQVLDVFYLAEDSLPGYAELQGYTGDDKANARRDHDPIIGWYGGGTALDPGIYLEMPTVEVFNNEKLIVTVKNPNIGKPNEMIKLFITGIESGAKAAFTLHPTQRDERVTGPVDGLYTIILDDITQPDTKNSVGWHFADLNDTTLTLPQFTAVEGMFQPGEDIIVEAVAYSNSTYANIAYSNQITTNSLFADVVKLDASGDDSASVTALIGNARHLENLDAKISGVNGITADAFKITAARQIADIDWDAFRASFDGKVRVYQYGTQTGTSENGFYPIGMPESIGSYEGYNHKISNITVDDTKQNNSSADASAIESLTEGGVFGSLANCEVKNLELINTRVTLSSGSAGALAGKLEGCTVTNVIAYNTPDFEDALGELNGNKNSVLTVTTSGSAGGLIGSMTDSTVSKSAAALVVRGGNAGGLIGESSGGAVSASFSGGHTDKGTGSGTGRYSTSDFNVTGSSVAGGLIGAAGSTGIQGCYSTCSVKGAKAGGLVGSAEGNVSNCYATGLVNDPAEEKTDGEGAFAGEFTGSAGNCHYYMIINERPVDKSDAEKGFAYLPAVGGSGTTGIVALDETAETYNEFVGSDWKSAVYYDKMLLNFYGKADGGKARFNLKTVSQLGQTLKESEADGTAYYVTDHYGDWPAPEIFVINTAG